MKPVPLVVALLFLLSACSSDPEPAGSPPTAVPPTSVPSTSVPSTSPGPTYSLAAAPDPCSLLTEAQLAPLLGTAPADPTPVDGDGERACAWGDGEFHGARLSLSEQGPGEGKPVDVGGRTGGVLHQDAYVCEVQVHTGGVAVGATAILAGGTELCAQAATALDTALDTLGW